MKNLTRIQSHVFEYVRNYLEDHGSAPTLREISAHINAKGTAPAICHLKALEKKGYIDRRNGTARGIVILKKQITKNAPSENDIESVPLVGTVRAGHPMPPIEDIEDYIKIDSSWLRGTGCFFLRVKGDSMIDDHVLEGDFALIRPQATAENRDIVVALVDGEATLKEFFFENGQIRLQPRNTNMEPIIIKPGDGDVRIIGKLIGVFRKFR